jgi:hypothetical protein
MSTIHFFSTRDYVLLFSIPIAPWVSFEHAFNTYCRAFYHTNNTATNITGHIIFDAIFDAPLTNVGLLGFAVEVTLLGDVKVPLVPFEGG